MGADGGVIATKRKFMRSAKGLEDVRDCSHVVL